MPGVIIIPFFALFGALLVDDRVDLTRRLTRPDLLRRGENDARRAGMSLGNVAVDVTAYRALRATAALRLKAAESLQIAEDLLESLDASGDLAAIAQGRKIYSAIKLRNDELERLEQSLRGTAIELGRLQRTA